MPIDKIHSFNRLTCLINIGQYNPSSPTLMDTGFTINTVIDVTIDDSYQTLTNKCEIKLPRDIRLYLNSRDDNGSRTNIDLNAPDSPIKQGDRVSVFLGYDEDYKMMFDGFIVTIESKSNFILKCEDFGWFLKQRTVSNISVLQKEVKLNEVLTDILDGTGISINEDTLRQDISIGWVRINNLRTIGEILENWKKNYGLLSFIKTQNGLPTLALTRTFFNSVNSASQISSNSSMAKIIDFQSIVVKDNFRFKRNDPNKIGMEAVSLNEKNERFSVTIIRNVNFFADKARFDQGLTTTQPAEFLVFRFREPKKAQKRRLKNGVTQQSGNIIKIAGNTDVSISDYDIRTYFEYNVSEDILIQNAISRFNEISQTGVDGDFTIFGDLAVRSTELVTLVDRRAPEKEGTYLATDVRTTFGSGGYRQKIKVPFKLKNS